MTEIKVNLISHQKLEGLSTEEKIQFILQEVEKGEILVLEKGLSAEEQTKLIEMTMKEINPDKFIGIEMEGYKEDGKKGFFQKLLGKIRQPRMILIGPANKLQTVYKDKDVIKTVIKGR